MRTLPVPADAPALVWASLLENRLCCWKTDSAVGKQDFPVGKQKSLLEKNYPGAEDESQGELAACPRSSKYKPEYESIPLLQSRMASRRTVKHSFMQWMLRQYGSMMSCFGMWPSGYEKGHG
jgi:hypothetical protein